MPLLRDSLGTNSARLHLQAELLLVEPPGLGKRFRGQFLSLLYPELHQIRQQLQICEASLLHANRTVHAVPCALNDGST